MNRCTSTNEVLHIERYWIYLQVLFESSFSLTERLNVAIFRIYAVTLGQKLNYFLYNSVILCSAIYL
jgi:hypothetical protein